jgi:hypothetical protein
MANSLFSLSAYVKNGTWMFDDESRDIKEEPFVAGADIMFDLMSGREADPTIESCNIVFGATPIPDHDVHVTLDGTDGYDGHYYVVNKFDKYPAVETFRFWLCPALLAFFDEAPQNIYVSIK